MSHQPKFSNSPEKASNIVGTQITDPRGDSRGKTAVSMVTPAAHLAGNTPIKGSN